MAGRAYINNEGALFEAYARGNKDTYFFKDDPVNAVNPFENRYIKTPPLIHELRRTVPLNGADFGRSCEFEFDVAGDLFQDVTVLIELPSWLPPTETALNPTTSIVGSDGNTYGYTNGIGYFLFSKIQLYQDKILLQETSGDALFASRAARGSLNEAYMDNVSAGFHDGTATSIGVAATPPRLRLKIPFLTTGVTDSFPSIGMRQQSFKLRLTLRKLEDIVESSAGQANPSPWMLPSFTVNTATPYTITPLTRTAIARPTLFLETRHIYTDQETRIAIQKTTVEIPYSRLYENQFTFGPADYAPLNKGATATVTRRVDAQHPASRLFWFIRSRTDMQAGKLWKFTADLLGGVTGQEYYTNQAFYIAARDRETLFPPLIWNKLTHHAKEDRDPGVGIGEMNWDVGSVWGSLKENQPEGSVNFTTADRPTILTELNGPLLSPTPVTEMTAVVDSWLLYTVEGGRGTLKYGN